MKKMRKTIALVTALLMLAALPTGALAAKREVPSLGFTLPQVLERAAQPSADPAAPEASPTPTPDPNATVAPDATPAPDAPVEPDTTDAPAEPAEPEQSWQGNANDGLTFGDAVTPPAASDEAVEPDAPVDGDVVDGEAVDGEVVDGEAVDGDVVDGDVVDGDVVDGEAVDGEAVDGEVVDDEVVDGEVADGDAADDEAVDGEIVDGEAEDGEPTPEPTATPEPTPEPDPWSGDADNGLSFAPTTVKVMSVADLLDPNRSIDIFATFEGELSFGSQMTLNAALNGYDGAVYTIQWQTSTDNATWTDIPGATGESYPLTVTEENYQNFWRVELTITDVIDG